MKQLRRTIASLPAPRPPAVRGLSWLVACVAGGVRRIPLWFYPLVIALALFLPTGAIRGTSDGMFYAGRGLNLFLGRGLVRLNGSPLFPLLIAASFRLLGVSAYSAFLAARIFYLLNPLVVYFLGQQLYGRWAGLLASLLVLTSYSLNAWSGLLHLDHILPFFILLALLCTLLAFERRSYAWLVAAGLSFGLAYLTKQWAILLFPLPILLPVFVPAYRQRRFLLGMLLLLGMAALLVLLWMGSAYSIRPERMLGISLNWAERSVARLTFLNTLKGMLLALPNYYRVHLQPNFLLAPLLVVGWSYSLVSALRGDRSAVFMSLALALLMPMVLFQGSAGYRSRQVTVFFQLSFLALAGFLWASAPYLQSLPARSSRLGPVRVPWRKLGLAVPVLVVVLQATVDSPGHLKSYLADYNTVASLLEKQAHPLTSDRGRELGEWLQANAPPGSVVMASETTNRYAFFFTGGRYTFRDYPFTYSDKMGTSYAEGGGKVLALRMSPRGPQQSQGTEYSVLRVLTEQSLRDRILEAEIDYVVVDRTHDLAFYFLDSPSFVKVADMREGRIQVFKVVDRELQTVEYVPLVDDSVVDYLEAIRSKDPERYAGLLESFFPRGLGWTDAQILSLGDNSMERQSGRVTVYNYAENKRIRAELAEAIRLHQQKAEAHPGNPWPHLALAALYAARGDHVASLNSYSEAAGAAPDRIASYLAQDGNYRLPLSPETQGSDRLYPTARLLDRIDVGPNRRSEFDQVSRSAFLITGEPGGVLFQHPPSGYSFSVRPAGHAFLRFGLAIAPEVWQEEQGDGVVFDLYIDDGQARWLRFSEYIDPKHVPADRKWHDREIDLSPWAGQVITLTFATDAGPAGNSDFDWAGWGEPRIVQPIAFDFLTGWREAEFPERGLDLVRRDALTIGDEPRYILFQHPSSQIAYDVDVPERAGLHFGIGVDPRVWDPEKGDGVEYSIYVSDPDTPEVLHRVFNRYIDPKNDPADRRWYDAVVDLTAYGGKTVDVIFEALPGPAGDDSYDWGGWSWPVLVNDDMALRPFDWEGLVSSEGEVP